MWRREVPHGTIQSREYPTLPWRLSGSELDAFLAVHRYKTEFIPFAWSAVSFVSSAVAFAAAILSRNFGGSLFLMSAKSRANDFFMNEKRVENRVICQESYGAMSSMTGKATRPQSFTI
jgi:hypothetical protein